MFTGIVSDIGTIIEIEQRGDVRVVVRCGYDMATVAIGASISCSGCCLTIIDKGADWFAADVSGETVAKTAQGTWTVGRRLNLERALKLGDELGGHIVTGHVDGVAQVISVVAVGDSHCVTIGLPSDIAPFVATKGSVTVDGVSLTVNSVIDGHEGSAFSINVIPHSWSVTTLGELTEARAVNLEIDVLARYLKRMRDVMAVV